jgi:formylglycine-generating enzyme required for sulfatase activity
MSQQPDQRPDALMSYTSFDDEHDEENLSAFRERLSREVRAWTGRKFHIFQDVEDIGWGQQVEQRIDEALDTIMFFIPILTPSFFVSKFCRYELERFLQREKDLGRNDLVLPVYYIRVPALEDPAHRAHDPLAQTLAKRQRIDWRELRFKPLNDPAAREMLAQMAYGISQHIDVQESEQKRREDAERERQQREATERERLRHQIKPPPRSAWLPKMVEIPAGPFLLGSSDNDPDAEDNEKPQQRMELPTYYIGKTPVTNAQFRPFVEDDGYTNPYYWTENGWRWLKERWSEDREDAEHENTERPQPSLWDDQEWNGDDYPVVGISWYEALAYCCWLSVQTGNDYRLPTEAEWEKAARGPRGLIYPWGNRWEEGRCNSGEAKLARTTSVHKFSLGASPYSVFDMAGNVWEWCQSSYKAYPQGANTVQEDFTPADFDVPLRGGSWQSERIDARCMKRDLYQPNLRLNDIGFRVLRTSD